MDHCSNDGDISIWINYYAVRIIKRIIWLPLHAQKKHSYFEHSVGWLSSADE